MFSAPTLGCIVLLGACSASPQQHAPADSRESVGDDQRAESPSSEGSSPNSPVSDSDEPSAETPAADPDAEPIFGYPPPPDPEDDADLRGALQGSTNIFFATECNSVLPDGSVVDGATHEDLPVGDGTVLECTAPYFPQDFAYEFTTKTKDTWCILFTHQSHRATGVSGLEVSVSGPGTGPARFTATHQGGTMTIHQAALGDFGSAWPLWVRALYSTKDVKKGPAGQCGALFGVGGPTALDG